MKTVLYIEDNETNVDIVQRMLEREGYHVLFALQGLEGIELAEQQHPDLIIVDLHLPGMNGYEITKRLKSNPSLEQIPILMLTADIYARQTGEEAGIDGYLNKPIRRKALLDAVGQMIA